MTRSNTQIARSIYIAKSGIRWTNCMKFKLLFSLFSDIYFIVENFMKKMIDNKILERQINFSYFHEDQRLEKMLI